LPRRAPPRAVPRQEAIRCLASPKHHSPWLTRPAKTPMILGMPLLRT
jgi:hypothetical protein